MLKEVNNIVDWVKNLCLPAKVEFIFGMFGLLLSLFNSIRSNKLCVGLWKCKSKDLSIIHVLLSLLWIFAWSYFLNYLCSKGHKGAAWVLVLLPYIIVTAIIFAFVSVGVMSKV
jgi:hypothetical protein